MEYRIMLSRGRITTSSYFSDGGYRRGLWQGGAHCPVFSPNPPIDTNKTKYVRVSHIW
jgi:hypothetical protein